MKVTADDIAQLMLHRPPRLVPDHVAQAAKGGRAGWAMVVFGLGFGAFGSLFMVFFFPWSFATGLELDLHGQHAPGVIVDQKETNMSVNETKVIAQHFRFTAADNVARTAVCYTTGPRWEKGATVEVAYLARNPARACLEGARLSQAGWMGAWVVIFPLIGFGLAGWSIVSRQRVAGLLRTGTCVEVDITDVAATRSSVNYQTIYKITVTAPALDGGRPVTFRRWDKREVNFATQRALVKQPVFVLYNPRRPKNLIFPEALIDPPSSPAIK